MDAAGPDPRGAKVNWTVPELPGVEEPNPTAGVVRVVTFNIQWGDEVERAAREMKADPDLRRADIVLLQEVSGREANFVAQALRMNLIYYAGSMRKGDEFGNAVLTTHTIVDDWKLDLPHQNPFNGGLRIAVGARLDTGAGQLVVYSVHNETILLGGRERLEQSAIILADAARQKYPVIIGGDFNTLDRKTRAETIRLFERQGFLRATRGVGPTAYNGPLGAHLDHVFVRALTPIRSRTVPTDASDHLPLFAEVALSSQEARSAGPADRRIAVPHSWRYRY